MYVMPHRTLKGIYQRVLFCNEHKSLSHPIKYYLENRKLLQNIVLKQADKLELIAPCERQCEELPRPWREHVYPEWNYGDNLVSFYHFHTFVNFVRRRVFEKPALDNFVQIPNIFLFLVVLFISRLIPRIMLRRLKI